MARRQRTSGSDEGGGQSVGAWIVTFSDCMTLLLCFFVLLLTFSSFEEEKLRKLAGAFDHQRYESIFDDPRDTPDSIVAPVNRPIDYTRDGSEKPTDEPPRNVDKPRNPTDLDVEDAYKDVRTFSLPSGRAFLGRTTRFHPGAFKTLDALAEFMKAVPCNAVVTDTSDARSSMPGGGGREPLGLQRAVAVVDYLTERKHLPRGRFSVAARPPARAPTAGAGGTLVISLVAESVYSPR